MKIFFTNRGMQLRQQLIDEERSNNGSRNYSRHDTIQLNKSNISARRTSMINYIAIHKGPHQVSRSRRVSQVRAKNVFDQNKKNKLS